MQYSDFEEEFFNAMKNEKSNLVEILEKNKDIVLMFLCNRKVLNNVIEFVNRFNDTLLEVHKFKNIEKALTHPLLGLVYEVFRQSDALIKALQEGTNTQAIRWLLTLPINFMIQNSEGVTALMYAVSHYNTKFAVNFLLKDIKKEDLNREDHNGNTALFYSVHNVYAFKQLLSLPIDYNHVNHDGDSLLIYACKHARIQPIELLLSKPDLNFEHRNNVCKNAAMILVEKNLYKQLQLLKHQCPRFDLDYRNKFGDTLVSIFIQRFNAELEKRYYIDFNTDDNLYDVFKDFGMMLKTLVEIQCNFNVAIDGDGNTPIMYFLLIKDYLTAYYLLISIPSLDLSMKNKYGVNASFLGMIIDEEEFSKDASFYMQKKLMENPTFDYFYVDSYGNSLLHHIIYKNDPVSLYLFSQNQPDVIDICNDKQENAIILATKLGKNLLLNQLLLNFGRVLPYDINHQDYLGNTALHYAVILKDEDAIKRLIQHQADIRVENHDGKSPIRLAEEMEDAKLKELLLSMKSLYQVGKEKEASSSNDLRLQILSDEEPLDKLFSKKDIQMKIAKGKEKALNEQLDKYIKNYRVTQYEKEYSYLGKYEFLSLYRPSSIRAQLQQHLFECYFGSKARDSVFSNRDDEKPKEDHRGPLILVIMVLIITFFFFNLL